MTSRPRRVLHAALVLLAMVPLGIAWACLALGIVGMVWADKVLPGALFGNCWSNAGPKWWKARDTAYLTMRAVRQAKLFMGWGIMPHVLFQRTLGSDADIEQTEPINRYQGETLGTRKLLFGFTIKRHD